MSNQKEFHTKKEQPPQSQLNPDDKDKIKVEKRTGIEKITSGMAKMKVTVRPQTNSTAVKKGTRTVKCKVRSDRRRHQNHQTVIIIRRRRMQ